MLNRIHTAQAIQIDTSSQISVWMYTYGHRQSECMLVIFNQLDD